MVTLLDSGANVPGYTTSHLGIFSGVVTGTGRCKVTPSEVRVSPLIRVLYASRSNVTAGVRAVADMHRRCPAVRVATTVDGVSFGLPIHGLVGCKFLMLTVGTKLSDKVVSPAGGSVLKLICTARTLLNLSSCYVRCVKTCERNLVNAAGGG